MVFFASPTSFIRNANNTFGDGAITMSSKAALHLSKQAPQPPHSSHPDFGHLVLLVFEAVLEVVCVSLPGYIVARQGMFNADAQKFVANLNVMVFTPCLIFTKLASQLTTDRLKDLAVIPFIFAAQILVSYLCSVSVSMLFRFKKRPRNFVVAMGVFGNSNSLPISLVLSLSKTLKGLHWDRIDGDNDDEVAARGILYLLIFQQLGQLVRWSWGYHVLLAPPENYAEDEHTDAQLEQGRYRDNPDDSDLIEHDHDEGSSDAYNEERELREASGNGSSGYESGEQTPMNHEQYTSSVSTNGSAKVIRAKSSSGPDIMSTPVNGNFLPNYTSEHIMSFPSIGSHASGSHEQIPSGARGVLARYKLFTRDTAHKLTTDLSSRLQSTFQRLPVSLQRGLARTYQGFMRFVRGVWAFMNPPLWAMLVAIVIASVPALQHLFFDEGTFIRNSVTRAVGQSGGVAVPLILVVLGANLARNTLPKEESHSIGDDKEERNLLIASLISRMLLPTIIMAPILALAAKYVPVSILDDPIFVIVCFLLTGAPSALQLAQICQINGVYMGAMSRLLFQSYVVWILPSTLVLVMLALEVVEWAAI